MLDDLVAANGRYAERFVGADKTSPPARQLAVLTCMDCRIEPWAVLGLELGDAAVVRNAGGRATPDALRSLALATRLLGVGQVVVLHHTDCALAGQTEASVRARLVETGLAPADTPVVLAMPDPDAALREDVEAVRSSPLLSDGVAVVGWRYDVATGRVRPIVP